MIEINGNRYVFAPEYTPYGDGYTTKDRYLVETDTPQEFCDKIAEAGSVSSCYRVEDHEDHIYFNTNVKSRKEIFIPLAERYHIAPEEYGFAWFLMPWGTVYVHSCGSGPNDSFYHSYTWSKVKGLTELKQTLFGEEA
jgi:hypothetical protein